MRNEDVGVFEDADGVILEYIGQLYTIEVLKEANVEETSLTQAWSYGQACGTVWKDDKDAVRAFYNTHRDLIKQYNASRINAAVTKLCNGLSKLDTNLFKNIPLEPQLVNSVLGCLEELATNKDTNIFDSSYRAKNIRRANSKADIADLQLADRILSGVFNNFTESRVDLDEDSSKKKYGASRHEILDNYNYLCYFKVRDLLKDALMKNPKLIAYSSYIDDKSHPNPKEATFWGTLFSVLYKLRIPKTMHPNSLDRMYEKYVLRNSQAAVAIENMRRYSSMTCTDVIGCSIPLLNPHTVSEDILPKHRNVGVTSIDTLIERYLVVQCLLSNNCF